MKPIVYTKNNDAAGEVPSAECMRVVEQTIEQEIDALLQVTIDMYLGQILIQNTTQNLQEDRLSKMESWICQLAGLHRAFTSDFNLNQNVNRENSLVQTYSRATAKFNISRNGTVLSNLLSNYALNT